MVGLLERAADRVPSHFREPGDHIVLLGTTAGHLGGSIYWSELCDFVGGRPAPVDLEAEAALQRLLAAAARDRLLRSAHDCSEGGLLVALAEAAIGGGYADAPLGATVDLAACGPDVADDAALLYGEDHGRVIASCAPEAVEPLLALARQHGVPAVDAGTVEARGGALTVQRWERSWTWSTQALRETYYEAIPRRMRHADADRSATGGMEA